MQSLAVNGYSADAVKKALHAANRVIAFRYDLLDSTNTLKKSLTNVTAGHIENNALSQIKRIAKFTIVEDGSINFLSDRIKPCVRLKMPDGGWAEWPQGVFLLSSPVRKANASRKVIREVDAYDQLQVLTDDKVTDRYTVAAGTNYITAVQTLLTNAGITAQNLTATTSVLPTALDWAPGTPKLTIINALLSAINYRSLWFNEAGQAIAQPYVSPSVRASDYTYIDDSQSVTFPEVEQGLDLFGVANKWVLVVTEPDQSVITSTYTNSNSASPTSTVNRGRTIVDFRTDTAPDQVSLDAKVQRLAFEASQVYEQTNFETAIMPMHSENDVVTLTFSVLGISAKYSEVSWTYDLVAGARMKHQIRRVVDV